MDLREVRLSACPKGQQWFVAKGDCKDIYEAEAVYCASAEEPHCTDRRTTFYPPCQAGEVMRFAQGRCPQPTEVEYVYCKKTK